MGYVYDKVKEALGGVKFSSSHQSIVKDWSPNGVKALVIYRDFIFVANHVKMPKVIPLDVNEFAMDLQQNGRTGALHNLLAQRQLSCMEEFYVDSVFMNYPGAMDMAAYISKLVNERSRLRFHGYISNANVEELREKFSKAKLNSDPIYSYALDGSRKATLSYTGVNNPVWYKNYNLRPQYYTLDADNGDLHRWFTKSEGIIADKLASQAKEMEADGIEKALNILVQQDLQVLNEVMMYLSLGMYLKNAHADKIFTCVRHGMSEGQKNFKQTIKGLLPQHLNSALSVAGSQGGSVNNLARAYKYFSIFDNRDGVFVNLEELTEMVKNKSGLLQFAGLLDSVLYETWLEMENHYSEGKLIMIIEAQKYKDDIPSGRFRTAIGMGEGSGCDYGLMCVLLGVCGWNHESFKRYLQTAKSKKTD